ncbi:MAG: type II toxin-antitoxin system VapC family toxin [Planctomycetes bacterium]|nr:type II toxin-antitoxin system VapC family toxin [Planctomycetota bacterium]
MAAVVADTHTIIWAMTNSPKLSVPARDALEKAAKSGEGIYISAITVVEIVYLLENKQKNKEKGVGVPNDALERLLEALRKPEDPYRAAPLDLNIASSTPKILRQKIPEIADRIISATALCKNLPLVTRDKQIRDSGLVETIW